MPTSGDLKSGDSISCTSSPPPPLQCQQTPTPHTTNQPSKLQNYDSHGNGLGHYMKSYMRYIPSRFAFIERSVCIRVCKHGCDVSCFAFRALITQARVWKSFSRSKLHKFTLFTHSFVAWNLKNLFKQAVSTFFRLSWHFKREKSIFWKASFCKTRTDYACKTSCTRLCDW